MYFTFYGRKVLRNYAGFTLRSRSVLLTPALFERTLYQNRKSGVYGTTRLKNAIEIVR